MSAPAPAAGDLARPCPTCGAGEGQPCVTRPWAGHPARVFADVHADRRLDFTTTAPMPVLRTWDGTEKRRWNETGIRADERGEAALRLIAWANTLPGGDERIPGVLAAAAIVREGR